MSKRERDNSRGDLPGQDSFLDIVANIVGILILLVVVVGVRAAATATVEEETAVADVEPLIDAETVEKANLELAVAVRDVASLRLKAAVMNADADALDFEREKLATYVASADEELSRRREELADNQREKYDLRVNLVSAEKKYDDLSLKQLALVSAPIESEQLKNVPTPLARRVEGDEVALRLEGDRVAIVPVDKLLSKFEQQGMEELRRLHSRDNTIGRLGPVNGFQMLFTLVARRSVSPAGLSVTMHYPVAEIRPHQSELGETIDEAVGADSQLFEKLSRLEPSKTAVTLWTYPDSFENVARLRQALYEKGFATAIRPLPKGTHIGLSPFGSKSRVQ